ncbi:hypothetical protein H8S90_14315 [Olivibacter sp. SDN3]|uniref:hypothetical protein n=1 Tax=Olivibacter sp. SDN3 TaxID=2764720 RepID=UPI0016512EDA|nr:hypothetical protein [Olivibacter sp. SDN3]QNL47984.1 hypothetical protein H8S90_14315 [Olivibacter sp. SDN3]
MFVFLFVVSCTERTTSKTGRSEGRRKQDATTLTTYVSVVSYRVPVNKEEIQTVYTSIMAMMENGTLDSTSFDTKKGFIG